MQEPQGDGTEVARTKDTRARKTRHVHIISLIGQVFCDMRKLSHHFDTLRISSFVCLSILHLSLNKTNNFIV